VPSAVSHGSLILRLSVFASFVNDRLNISANFTILPPLEFFRQSKWFSSRTDELSIVDLFAETTVSSVSIVLAESRFVKLTRKLEVKRQKPTAATKARQAAVANKRCTRRAGFFLNGRILSRFWQNHGGFLITERPQRVSSSRSISGRPSVP